MSPELAIRIGAIIGGFLTLMMFSFIFKDNPFFRFGEHLYLGIAVGYYANIQWFNFVKPKLIEKVVPMLGPAAPLDPTNPTLISFPKPEYLVIIPAILGIFVILRLVKRIAWLSRITFAFIIGGFSGINIPNVINGLILPQLVAACTAIVFVDPTTKAVSAGSFMGGIDTLLMIIGTFCVLVYFFFSIEHKGMVFGLSKVGIYVLMITFGAAFGNTVMARMSLLIGRIQFLLFEWFRAFAGSPVQ